MTCPTTNIPQAITVQQVLSAEVPQRVGAGMVLMPAIAVLQISGAAWR